MSGKQRRIQMSFRADPDVVDWMQGLPRGELKQVMINGAIRAGKNNLSAIDAKILALQTELDALVKKRGSGEE